MQLRTPTAFPLSRTATDSSCCGLGKPLLPLLQTPAEPVGLRSGKSRLSKQRRGDETSATVSSSRAQQSRCRASLCWAAQSAETLRARSSQQWATQHSATYKGYMYTWFICKTFQFVECSCNQDKKTPSGVGLISVLHWYMSCENLKVNVTVQGSGVVVLSLNFTFLKIEP